MIFPSHDDQEQEIISIIGKKESVEKAKKELEDLVCNLVNDIKMKMHFLYLKTLSIASIILNKTIPFRTK